MSYVHRLTTLTGGLEYGKLKKAGVVPKEAMFTKVPKLGGKMPKFARKVEPWWLGYFVDCLVHLVLQHRQFHPEYLLEALDDTGREDGCSEDSILRDVPYFEDLAIFLLENVSEGAKLQHEPEWVSDCVMGHPDLIIDDTIYDIKTTGRFGAMRIATIFQLLGYAALAQANGNNIKYIGVLLPCQGLLERVPISAWKGTQFLQLLQEEAVAKEARENVDPLLEAEFALIEPHIGAHVGRESTLRKTLDVLDPHQPIQIFLGSRLNTKHSFSDKDLAATAARVAEVSQRVFVHSPYSLNLCREYPDDWVIVSLIEQLATLRLIGGQGVVVHIGKKAEMDYDTAYYNMCDAVIQVAETTEANCPLLIETDSGGSILDDPSDLAAFYEALPDHVKDKAAICVDTCHVFAANFCPWETLRMFEDRRVPVRLIHYNDSKFAKGSKQDRHMPIGEGLIGMEILIKVAKHALGHQIAMVYE